jgi:hypothetical protein
MIQIKGHCSDGGPAPKACEIFGNPQLLRSCCEIEEALELSGVRSWNNATPAASTGGIADTGKTGGAKLLYGANDDCTERTLITSYLLSLVHALGLGARTRARARSRSRSRSRARPHHARLGPLFREFVGLPPLSVFSRGPLIRWHSSAPVGSARSSKSCPSLLGIITVRKLLCNR